MKACHFTSAHTNSDIRIFIKECCSLASAGYETYLASKEKPIKHSNDGFCQGNFFGRKPFRILLRGLKQIV